MNKDIWNDAFNEISDKHLAEALEPRKKSRISWLGTVAAALAVSVLTAVLGPALLPVPAPADPTQPSQSGSVPTIPGSFDPETDPPQEPTEPGEPGYVVQLHRGLISAPVYPVMAPYPTDPYDRQSQEYAAWSTSLKNQYDQPQGYGDSLLPFFRNVIPTLLDSSVENAVCSPLNIYMALAMLAEATGGDSRQQVLDLLGSDSLQDSRTQAGYVWNANYRTDGTATSLLANSLWLRNGYYYNKETVDTLSSSYYASVYQGKLGSPDMNNALQAWLSVHTQGMLDEFLNTVTMDPDTALALASTVTYRARWDSGFSPQQNTQGVFHSSEGDRTVTYMNKTLFYGVFYQGQDYSMVQLDLEYSGGMWLILPEEGFDISDILESGYALDAVLDPTKRQSTNCMIHISLPKFDISAQTDLTQALTELGLGDLFNSATADFTGILPQEQQAFLGQAPHAARVTIDEEGISAAAYTVMMVPDGAMPPEDEITFTLDRPFFFVITGTDGLPMFAGVVNQP